MYPAEHPLLSTLDEDDDSVQETSVGAIKAREMMRLQQEHMRNQFAVRSPTESIDDTDSRFSEVDSTRSESVGSFASVGDASDEPMRTRTRSDRSVSSFRDHGENSDEDSDGDIPRLSPEPVNKLEQPVGHPKKFKRASVTDTLPMRLSDPKAPIPPSPSSSVPRAQPPRNSLRRELTTAETKLLKLFSTDALRDDAIDDSHTEPEAQ